MISVWLVQWERREEVDGLVRLRAELLLKYPRWNAVRLYLEWDWDQSGHTRRGSLKTLLWIMCIAGLMSLVLLGLAAASVICSLLLLRARWISFPVTVPTAGVTSGASLKRVEYIAFCGLRLLVRKVAAWSWKHGWFVGCEE
jgi:hypothetical protein